MSLATLEGAASINNTYTLGMFMFIIYYQGTEPSMRFSVAIRWRFTRLSQSTWEVHVTRV